MKCFMLPSILCARCHREMNISFQKCALGYVSVWCDNRFCAEVNNRYKLELAPVTLLREDETPEPASVEE